jgi:AcrR family transcriptional regulator
VIELARRAGVSKGLTYRHFGSKSGVLAAVVEEFYDGYDAAVHERRGDPSATWATRERQRLEDAIRFHYDDPLATIILNRLELDPVAAAARAARVRRHIQTAADNLRRGQATGEIDAGIDPDLAADVIIGGLHQALADALARPRRPEPRRLSDSLWHIVCGALRLEPHE